MPSSSFFNFHISKKRDDTDLQEPSDVYWEPNLSADLAESFSYDLGDHGWGNQELQNYTSSPENSFIGDDKKTIIIRAIAERDSNGQERFTSARLVSQACLSESRGYVEAQIDAPFAKGIWYAFWLLPKKPFAWPGDGEIDICESWNGLKENGTCLHWGHFNGQDWNKHRVLKLKISSKEPHRYGFAWDCPSKMLLWFTDGKVTMRATIPEGTRDMREYQILLNVAMGGNVMHGSKPQNPSKNDMIISDLKMYRVPPGGWDSFPKLWKKAREGNTM